MNLKLRVWREGGSSGTGHFEDYDAIDISPDMSFLEMFDVLNEALITSGKPVLYSELPDLWMVMRRIGIESPKIEGSALDFFPV